MTTSHRWEYAILRVTRLGVERSCLAVATVGDAEIYARASISRGTSRLSFQTTIPRQSVRRFNGVVRLLTSETTAGNS